MNRSFWKAAILAGLAAGVAFAAGGQGRNYDPKTEVTVAGTVEEVKVYPSRSGGAGGEHLLLKTEKGVLDVRLGPSAFLKEIAFDVARGDAVEVVGSKLKAKGSESVIARQVRKGEKTWTLRSPSGMPEWSRGPKGS